MLKLFKRRYSNFCTESHIKKVKNLHLSIPKLVSGYHDKIIPNYLRLKLPEKYFNGINNDCDQFATKLENEWFHLHTECELIKPSLVQYDAWGKRIDKIETCSAWKTLKQISCNEGLVALPYENNSLQFSRVHQTIKLLLFTPLSGLYSCPLAMTDAAAYVIERLGKPSSLSNAFQRLTCRDPHKFWTSGQWMTEKKGGSDVAGSTETVAVWDKELNIHRLYGCKWFCSATDSDMAFTLARSLDSNSVPIPGSKGLSLYYIETKSQEENTPGYWNNISIVSLKDKLGTRQLPTAEIILDGSKAIKLSDDGRGVSSISGMLTVTRIHNAIAAVGAMRRITMLALEYAKHRVAFGSKLVDKPLHAYTIAKMDIESRAAFYFLMDVVQLLGLQENKMGNEEETAALRVFSPLLKLYTAKQAMSVVSEGLECFGGQGFIESTGLPGMLRDAQVLPIWEGTTNILSLDTMRALGVASKPAAPEHRYFHHVIARCQRKINSAADQKHFPEFCENLSIALKVLEKFILSNASNSDRLQLYSRHISYSISRIYMGILLLEVASSPGAVHSDRTSLQYWMKKDLVFGLKDHQPSEINWKAFFD